MNKIRVSGRPDSDSSWCWKEFLKFKDSEQEPFEYPAGTVIFDEVSELTEEQLKYLIEKGKYHEYNERSV